LECPARQSAIRVGRLETIRHIDVTAGEGETILTRNVDECDMPQFPVTTDFCFILQTFRRIDVIGLQIARRYSQRAFVNGNLSAQRRHGGSRKTRHFRDMLSRVSGSNA
jgi:hypothetical protein